ncbi:MAG: DEAD-box ATP-dependent RNA helicase DeaD [Cytophagales bacterium]|jgi:ATP-dependent RNA helicase DeaD|nr:DEAD/DEAH box helicase [Bacteroidota bacterium]MBS1979576.1 DEAD/DEAH box helicase [Bacteroidota bacterium]WHZ09223.1 MAG: DEAD-box ATP-dependent RNA helicase DeaD [Cytophagales bacterium]
MKSFDALGLSGELVEVIRQMGFENPTPIQEKAIPVLLQGNTDLVGLAQTGTGKTAAFGLPLLELVDANIRSTQALIVAPTRELSVQITNDLERFAKGFKDLNIVTVYGGASISDQIRKVKRGAQVIVATPGRLIDLLSRKVVDLTQIKFVVLDEADEMLNMGFKEDIDEILSTTPDTKNVWLFSATMPREVRDIASNYMNNPQEIAMEGQKQGNENIDHQYALVDDRDKYLALKRFVDYTPGIFAVVFCRTKMDTQKIAEHLIKDGYNADPLHGDLTQAQRDRVMKSFKNKTLQLLVATDVAARGIDVSNITHVIHMNMPDEMEFYTHRSGRTARAGKKGISLAIVSKKEMGRIYQVEKSIKRKFTQVPVPSGDEVCQQKMMDLAQKVRTVEVSEEEIDSFLPEVYHELKDFSKEDIIKRFASIEFNRFLEYYRDARDLNKSDRSERKRFFDEDGMEPAYSTGDRIFINIGKMDGLDKGSLLGLICDYGETDKTKIGKIDLKGAYSFFEVEKGMADQIMQGFDGVEVRGRKVRLEMSGDRPERRERSGDRGDRRDRGDRGDRGGDRGGRSGGGRRRSFSGNRREDSWGGKRKPKRY